MTGEIQQAAPLEAGAPSSDLRAFRRCLGQFATGVTVMTASCDGRLCGMTVNSFAALSLEPALVLWSIRRESASLALYERASHFAVNVLNADQVAVSALFGTPVPGQFDKIAWTAGRGAAPLLQGAIAHLECRLARRIDAGDHIILIGEVENFARHAGEPLLFTQGRYAVPQEHPGAVLHQEALPPSAVDPAEANESGLLRLLHYASHQMASAFDAEREEEGFSVSQMRIASWLRTKPRTLEEIQRIAYLGKRDAQDTVETMRECGQLTRDADGVLHLTHDGRSSADAVAKMAGEFEQSLLHGLSHADIAAARKVLTAIGARASNHPANRVPADAPRRAHPR